MFAYSDPTGTGFLAQVGALEAYRNKVRTLDEQFDALPNSDSPCAKLSMSLRPEPRQKPRL